MRGCVRHCLDLHIESVNMQDHLDLNKIASIGNFRGGAGEQLPAEKKFQTLIRKGRSIAV